MAADISVPEAPPELETLLRQAVKKSANADKSGGYKSFVIDSSVARWRILSRSLVSVLVLVTVFFAGAVFSDAIRSNIISIFVDFPGNRDSAVSISWDGPRPQIYNGGGNRQQARPDTEVQGLNSKDGTITQGSGVEREVENGSGGGGAADAAADAAAATGGGDAELPSLRKEAVKPDTGLGPKKTGQSFAQVGTGQEEVIKLESWREDLEKELKEAHEIIEGRAEGKPIPEEEGELLPEVYHDVDKFRRSYFEMEQRFRIYVYEEGEKPLVHDGPVVDIYATEGLFIKSLVPGSHFVTNNYKKAHLYFLPYSVVWMVRDLWRPAPSRSMKIIADYIVEYVNKIASVHPYWNRTAGHDHFFISCHDWGNAVARDHDQLRRNAIKVVCVAAENEEFVPGKDVSLPEIYVRAGNYPGVLGGPPPKARPLLAFFAGQNVGKVRPTLIKTWREKDPSIVIYEKIPEAIAKKRSYQDHMKSSKYCLCPAGYEVNSPRIVEAISYECVPVIIADGFHKPFAHVLNWDAFSITVEEKDIPNLKNILLSIPEDKYNAMQSRLKHVRRHFIFHQPVRKYDVFHMLLHNLWTNKLAMVNKL